MDGYAAYYTKSNTKTGGIPDDGRFSVGNIPFHLNTSSGNDCIRLGWGDTQKLTQEINLGTSNIKNIYVLGITAGNSINSAPPTQFKYTISSDSSQSSGQTANLYNYFANPSKWANDTNIVGYTQNYYIRTCSREIYRPTNESGNPNMQCCKLDTSNLTLDNNNKLTVEYDTTNNNSESDGKGQFLAIFAITAEVEPDDNNTSQLIPLDIKNSFNSNEIWGEREEWSSITSRWGHYYTKNHKSDANGLPTDGKITVSNIPFNVNVLSGNDCVNIANEIGTINFSIPIKAKNLYILGTLNGLNSSKYTNPDNFNVEFYDENNNKITQYTQNLDAYDWCYSRNGLSQIIGTGTSSLVGYKDYNVRLKDENYYSGDPAMQCWRLNKFTDNSASFEDNQIKTIKLNKIGESPSNLMIFGITAEIDNDVTLVDLKHDSFKIVCGTSGEKQVKISTTEGADNEGIMENDNTAAFPYTPTVTEGTNYCTIYDDDKKAYYYFAVTTKKSLKIVVQTPSGLVYNGAAQQLVTGCLTLDAHGAARPADENDLLKSNIYLRIENATGTPAHKTGWYNLNSLANLTATNAGTYNIYYELDKGALSDYDLISTTVVSGTSESNNSIIIDENGD